MRETREVSTFGKIGDALMVGQLVWIKCKECFFFGSSPQLASFRGSDFQDLVFYPFAPCMKGRVYLFFYKLMEDLFLPKKMNTPSKVQLPYRMGRLVYELYHVKLGNDGIGRLVKRGDVFLARWATGEL